MLKELKTQHREIARLRFEGLSPQEISVRMEMKLQTVYNILRDPMCKSYIDGLQDKADVATLDVRKELVKLNTHALATLKTLLTEGNIPANVQLGAAKDVLDRTGYKPIEQHQHLHGHFTAEDIQKLKERAQQEKEQILELN